MLSGTATSTSTRSPCKSVLDLAGLRQKRHHAKTQVRPCTPVKCTAAAAEQLARKPSLISAGVEKLFNFPAVYAAAVKQARKKIVDRGAQLGVDFDAEVAKLREAADWDAELQAVQNVNLQLPSYYTTSFHAYSKGNLCWEAALEANLVSQFVHASVMDPNRKIMSAEGDAELRSNYSSKLRHLMQQASVSSDIRHIVDLGCSTGLSSLELHKTFPSAQITAIDLSPHFVAVAKVTQQLRQEASRNEAEPISFQHAAAEHTQLPDSSQDLVSACLLFHELPQSAAQQIVQEAHRILKPGGALAIMEMNPRTPSFQRVLGNPFAYAAFKSTEPWLLEYMALDLPQLAKDVGFASASEVESTPSHKTFLACKR